MNPLNCSQLHYTSCRYGLSGHAGFQTRAMSDTILPEEQSIMERLGIYQLPRNLNPEIDETFPIAYRHLYLESGKLVVLRSVYVGKDYTGRGGNYFVHALLIDHLPDMLWPVDLYEQEYWKNSLEDHEDIEQSSYNLPILSFIPNDAAYGFYHLQDFLQEEKSRSMRLAEMIQAVLLRAETSRSLVIQEELMGNCTFWLACIQKSFPVSCQKELSCSSYQFDPRSCLAINLIYGDTDFSLGENERKYQFYVFDFINDIHSDIGDVYREYAEIISSWMAFQPEKLKSFYEFSALFDMSGLSSELLIVLRLFQISMGEKLLLSDQDVVRILEFINNKTKKNYFSYILNILDLELNQLVLSENPDHLCHLATYFVNASRENDNHSIRIKAYDLIVRLFEKLIFEKNILADRLEEIRLLARASNPVYDHEFSEIFLAERHLSKLYSNISGLDNLGLAIIMQEMIAAVRYLKVEEKPLRDFIAKAILIKQPDLYDLDWLFLSFKDDVNDVAEGFVYICEILDSSKIIPEVYDEAIKHLSIYLYGFLNSKNYYFDAINLIKESKLAWLLVEKEWLKHIAHVKDKISFHDQYDSNIFKNDSKFSRINRSDFAQSLWDVLSVKERFIQAKIWLNAGQIMYFQKDLLSLVFQNINENISFNLSDQESDVLCKFLDDNLSKFHIRLKPNRILLRNSILDVKDNKIQINERYMIDLHNELSVCDSKNYAEFVMVYLPKILSHASSTEQHDTVIKSILLNQFSDSFLKAYRCFFEQGASDDFNQAEQAALKFWISLSGKNYAKYNNIHEEVFELLAHRIARLKEPVAKKLMRVKLVDINLTPVQKNKLKAIFQRVEENRNTFGRRILRYCTENIQKLTNKQLF